MPVNDHALSIENFAMPASEEALLKRLLARGQPE